MFFTSENHQSFIPKELLEKSDKILIICYLAIGDFTYLQTCFKKLHEEYPNLKIDLWADEYRGRSRFLRWGHKKNDILYEWVESTPYFNKFYKNIGAWWNLNKFFKQLKQENYPIVVSLFCSNRQSNVAKYARIISPKGFLAGVSDRISEKVIMPSLTKHYLNAFDRFFLSTKTYNPRLPIMDFCANSFEWLFGLKIKKSERSTFINIPQIWLDWAKDQINGYKANPASKVVFINMFAKVPKRCWTPEKAIALIALLNTKTEFNNCIFLINSMPQHRDKLDALFKKHFSSNVFLFTANKSFFQLPAILSECNLVVSVDTSVVHLSNTLNIPLVDLIRQKNTDWEPKTENSLSVYTKKKSDWVKHIQAEDVAQAIEELMRKI